MGNELHKQAIIIIFINSLQTNSLVILPHETLLFRANSRKKRTFIYQK